MRYTVFNIAPELKQAAIVRGSTLLSGPQSSSAAGQTDMLTGVDPRLGHQIGESSPP